jgi:hypothetical protein
MPKRRKLATGIYEDAYGRSVIVSVHGKPKEFRFEKDRPVDLLMRWRKRKIGDATDTPAPEARGSLARDIVHYLKQLKARRYRAALTPARVAAAVALDQQQITSEMPSSRSPRGGARHSAHDSSPHRALGRSTVARWLACTDTR